MNIKSACPVYYSVVVLSDLLTPITARFLVKAINKSVQPHIASDLPERVYTDRYKLELIINSLIFKALKSPPINQAIAINAQFEAEVLVLTITYTGMMFELGSEVDGAATPNRQTSMAKHALSPALHTLPITLLVERMSGHLSYTSHPSQHCCITLMLPLRIVSTH